MEINTSDSKVVTRYHEKVEKAWEHFEKVTKIKAQIDKLTVNGANLNALNTAALKKEGMQPIILNLVLVYFNIIPYN